MSWRKGGPPKPCGKKKLSKGQAEGVVESARRSQHEHRQECRIYFCRGCGCWHTSKREFQSLEYRTSQKNLPT